MVSTLIKDISVLVFHESDPASDPASDAVSPWKCSLSAKYSPELKQAAILLHSFVPIYGFNHKQYLVLSYEPDNLVPGKNFLKPAKNTHIVQDQLADLQRDGNPRWNILSLTLKEHCVIWYPPTCQTLRPKLGLKLPFCQFEKLARAKTVHVLFDYNWVHESKAAQFEDIIINNPESWTGLRPDQRHQKNYNLSDCSVFSPVDDTVAKALPPHNTTPSKRSKDDARSSLLRSPSPKRVHFSPAPVARLSAVKKATTALTPSSKPISSPPNSQEAIQDATPSPHTRSEVDLVAYAETKLQEIFAQACKDTKDLVAYRDKVLMEINSAFDNKLNEFNNNTAKTVAKIESKLRSERRKSRRERRELRRELRELRRERREFRIERGELGKK